MSDIVERPWRCDVTGNPVGTDTRRIGAHPCGCQGCRAADEIERLRAAVVELTRIISNIARAQAECNLAASEMAGVVESWKAHARDAEAEMERLRADNARMREALKAVMEYERQKAQLVGLSDCTCIGFSRATDRAYENGECVHQNARAALGGKEHLQQEKEQK